jgi:hypothetical protein
MAKVVCESCGTSFLPSVVKDIENCPVCGKPLWSQDDEEETSTYGEVLSFGEGIELGENDSFDEDKIDFWWYSIKEPSADGTSRGRVYTTCTKCGNLSYVTYPVARTKDYLLISPKCRDKCGHCGNELKNHIISKRPESWVDPRKRDIWVKDYENIPKCPICSSTKIHKISLTNKAASAVVFGVLSAGHVSKTYKCDTCGAKF